MTHRLDFICMAAGGCAQGHNLGLQAVQHQLRPADLGLGAGQLVLQVHLFVPASTPPLSISCSVGLMYSPRNAPLLHTQWQYVT